MWLVFRQTEVEICRQVKWTWYPKRSIVHHVIISTLPFRSYDGVDGYQYDIYSFMLLEWPWDWKRIFELRGTSSRHTHCTEQLQNLHTDEWGTRSCPYCSRMHKAYLQWESLHFNEYMVNVELGKNLLRGTSSIASQSEWRANTAPQHCRQHLLYQTRTTCM